MSITHKAYSRAGLLGNPSDGYHGKTISLIIKNFWAEVSLSPSTELEIIPSTLDQAKYSSLNDLMNTIENHGYYGGVRLIKAAIKCFYDYCQSQQLALPNNNFSIRYSSTIPQQVGLAGSSAIVVATLRCLMEFFEVEIPLDILPSVALAAENDELGIAAGLQDRVIQCFEGVVMMDFGPEKEKELNGVSHFSYTKVQPNQLPNLYIAYKLNVGSPTEIYHNRLRERYNDGEPLVVDTMQKIAELVDEAQEALKKNETRALARLINQNFDYRAKMSQILQWQQEMISLARNCGASAKFAGSGGAIIGTYEDEKMLAGLTNKFAHIGVEVVRPIVG